MLEPTRQIDDAIAWHKRKIEIAKYQIRYHEGEIKRLNGDIR